MSYRPTAEEFEKPTPQLLVWLQYSLSYYETQGNEKAIAVFQSLLEDAKRKSNIITRSMGFTAMKEAALGVPNTSAEEPESETKIPPTSEFTRQIEAATGRNEQPDTTIPKTATMTGIFRQIDESQFPDFCDPQKCPPDFARHCRANTEAHFGKVCIYKTLKNEEMR